MEIRVRDREWYPRKSSTRPDIQEAPLECDMPGDDERVDKVLEDDARGISDRREIGMRVVLDKSIMKSSKLLDRVRII